MTPARQHGGFTLLELSIVLIIISVIIAFSFVGQNVIESTKRTSTNLKLDQIEKSLMAFRVAHNRLPCPADATLLPNDINNNYGVESVSGGACTTGSTYNTTTGIRTVTASPGPTANYLDTKHAVVEGAVPFKALGLPEEFMYDGWGRKFSYAVNYYVTAPLAMVGEALNESCNITVNDASGNPRTAGAVYALVSYGEDGHGGYLKTGTRLNAGSTNTDELANCHCDNVTAAETTYAASYVGHDATQNPTTPTNQFGDLVRFKDRWQLMTYDDMYSSGGPVCTGGFIVTPSGANQGVGLQATFADVNNDGIPDLLLTAQPSAWGYPPQVYVVFGTKTGFPNPLPLTSLNGSNGFTITGIGPNGGWISLAAGDVNGDGIADIVIAVSDASGVPSSYAFMAYVIFGSGGSWPATFNVNTLNGSNGSAITLPSASTQYGLAIGDVNGGTANGNKLNDIIVGNANYNSTNPYNGIPQAGAVYVFFGQSGPWPGTYASPSSYTSLNGANGFTVNGATSNEFLGDVVAAGDINGDGIDDLVVSYDAAGGSGFYVIFGSNGNWPNPSTGGFNPTSLTGVNGFTITNTYAQDGYAFGSGLAFADINGDGIKDLIFGENYYGGYANYTGRVSVLFGEKSGWLSSYNMSSPPSGCCTQFIGTAVGDAAGFAVSSAGDFNGDGYEDLLIVAPGASPNGVSGAGSAFVVFGSPSYSSTATFNLSSLNGSNGVRFDGVVQGLPNTSFNGNRLSVGDGGEGGGLPKVAAGNLLGGSTSSLFVGDVQQTYGGNAEAGIGYVVYGSKKKWTSPVSLGTLCPGSVCQ